MPNLKAHHEAARVAMVSVQNLRQRFQTQKAVNADDLLKALSALMTYSQALESRVADLEGRIEALERPNPQTLILKGLTNG